MTAPYAALLVPELRWDPGLAFTHLAESIDDLLELGVGGFIIRGGTRDDVASLTGELHRRSRIPLLVAMDAPRGAGGAVQGLTGLPPAGALAALRDDDAIRRAARITARELRGIGVNWVLGPRADLALESRNPFLGADSFGDNAQKVAEWCVAWSEACQAEGVLATAAHYPGIGRALEDPATSAVALGEPKDALWGSDLVPFRALADAGVATVLAAQVSNARLDASGAPAARSPLLLNDWLRGDLGFEGLIVSDALPYPSDATTERDAAVESLAAGADLLLAPRDIDAVCDGLDRALDENRLSYDALEQSQRRRTFWAQLAQPGVGRDVTLEDVLWARQVGDTVTHLVRGTAANVAGTIDVISVDDDAESGGGGERMAPFLATWRAMELSARAVDTVESSATHPVIVGLIGGPAAGRGRPGLREGSRRRVAEIVSMARSARRAVVVVMFAPPALAKEIPEAPNVLCAWSADRAMQEAAARKLSALVQA